MAGLVVAKVGGSLFDMSDLGSRLRSWINQSDADSIVLVPGGGSGADVIRDLHRTHQFTEEFSHGMAIRLMSLNAHFLAELLDVPVTKELGNVRLGVLDTFAYCNRYESQEPLGHSWRVTSDTIAAYVAVHGKGKLALLKSCEIPAGISWMEAATRGLVDSAFPEIIAKHHLWVDWVNLRDFSI